eukprot:493140-Amorphochlora_amoeboformis.AAC.4
MSSDNNNMKASGVVVIMCDNICGTHVLPNILSKLVFQVMTKSSPPHVEKYLPSSEKHTPLVDFLCPWIV